MYRNGKLRNGAVTLSDEQLDDLLIKLLLEEYDHHVGVANRFCANINTG